MTDNPGADDTPQKPAHNIAQPPLRPLEPNERVVRIAGLRFILPCRWSPGDVLDENSALLINTAWHSALINRFGETKRVMLENPACTYLQLDEALQGFEESFKYTPRPIDASDPKAGKSQEERALESFARPHFNKAMRGHGLSRPEYEKYLQSYIADNRDLLLGLMADEKRSINRVIESLSGAFGES